MPRILRHSPPTLDLSPLEQPWIWLRSNWQRAESWAWSGRSAPLLCSRRKVKSDYTVNVNIEPVGRIVCQDIFPIPSSSNDNNSSSFVRWFVSPQCRATTLNGWQITKMNVVRTCFSSFKDIKLLHIGQIRWSFTKRCLWDELIGRCLFQSGLMNGTITLQIDDLIRRIVIRPVDCSRLTVFDFN